MRIARLILAGSIVAAGIGAAQAQSTAAAGSVIVVPLVAQTVSYSTEVTVRNPNLSSPIVLSVRYYEAINAAAPGLVTCAPLLVAANEAKAFTLQDQCGVSGASHFGLLVLEDAAVQKTNVFFAYSRTQTPGGNGFSVEGFPVGAFSGAPAEVVGLKRQTAAPTYQSNCFVGALGEALNYQITLRQGVSNGVLIGGAIAGTLQPFEMKRFLDVFTGPDGANAPDTDYSNVRANFSVTSGAQALIGFCTVQESTFFGADFRIAKSLDASNDRERHVACIGQDSCGTVSVIQPEQILNTGLKNIYSAIITQPDYVSCELVGPRASELQMRLRDWSDPVTSPQVAGGTNQTSFYAFTGHRNAVASGKATRWFIDVAARAPGATVPINFGITCRSGNGIEVPWFRGTAATDF